MKFIKIVISILLPFFLLILFASILTTKPYLLISKDLYESHEDVYFDHDYAADRIMGYLNYRYDNLEFGIDENDDSVILEDIEIRHMDDVKNLYTLLRVSAIIALVIAGLLSFLLYKKNKEEFYKTFKNLYLGPMFFVMFLGTFFIIDFDRAFDIFHKIFFTNNDYQLQSTDVLLILLPFNFWLVSASIILLLFSLSFGLIYFVNERLFKK